MLSSALFPAVARSCRVHALGMISTLIRPGRAPADAARGDRAAKREFNIPAGDAASTLRMFVEQSGEQCLYCDQGPWRDDSSRKGRVHPSRGLERMVRGTSLTVVEDKSSGALTVTRADRRPKGRLAQPLPPRLPRTIKPKPA